MLRPWPGRIGGGGGSDTVVNRGMKMRLMIIDGGGEREKSCSWKKGRQKGKEKYSMKCVEICVS